MGFDMFNNFFLFFIFFSLHFRWLGWIIRDGRVNDTVTAYQRLVLQFVFIYYYYFCFPEPLCSTQTLCMSMIISNILCGIYFDLFVWTFFLLHIFFASLVLLFLDNFFFFFQLLLPFIYWYVIVALLYWEFTKQSTIYIFFFSFCLQSAIHKAANIHRNWKECLFWSRNQCKVFCFFFRFSSLCWTSEENTEKIHFYLISMNKRFVSE